MRADRKHGETKEEDLRMYSTAWRQKKWYVEDEKVHEQSTKLYDIIWTNPRFWMHSQKLKHSHKFILIHFHCCRECVQTWNKSSDALFSRPDAGFEIM